ncbi:MAG: hypothetical protein ABIS18_00735 [Actinomycetota bacterium]
MDVDNFAELIELVEAGQVAEPIKGEAKGLLSLAKELRALAPPVVLPAETEHRIFAKMQALAPDLLLEDAYSLDEDLSAVAEGLKSLAPVALTQESEDRIFARVQHKMPELAFDRKHEVKSWSRRIAAIMPKAPAHNKADALAAMIDRAQAGESVAATGAGASMDRLLHAAMSLGPLPTVEPSASFVDWLEVRLASPSALQPAKRNRAAALLGSINSSLQSTRTQGALAGATALLVAIAAFNIGGGTTNSTNDPRPDGGLTEVVGSPKLPDGNGGSPPPTFVDQGQSLAINLPGDPAQPEAPQPGPTASPTPSPTPTPTDSPTPPPSSDDSVSVAADASRYQLLRLDEALTTIGGPR